MKKEFIQEECNGRIIEINKVQNKQTHVSQQEVSIEQVQPQHTPPLRWSKIEQIIPLKYDFIISTKYYQKYYIVFGHIFLTCLD